MKKQKIHVLLYYKFTDIENPEKFAQEQLELCKRTGVLGRILVGKEGINGSVSGTMEGTEEYKKEMKKDKRFSDMMFKEDISKSNPFTKIKVLVKNEIIAMKEKVNLSKKADYISPEDFLDLYKNKDNNLIILDTRNDYEWKVGKFKNAMVLPIKTFRDFPNAVRKLLKGKENKKIVTYCTGGIRCEKASAFLKEQGFNEVYQLKDGILNFCKEYPNSVWEGKCFVFDKRLMTKVNNKDSFNANCVACEEDCDLCKNCRNVYCDKLVTLCVNCDKKMIGCCSLECLSEFKKQCALKSIVKQGRRTQIKTQL